MKNLAFILALAAAATSAGAADVVIDGGGYNPGGPALTTPSGDADATAELAWDNGTRRWSIAWYTGSGAWVGNDFSVATLKTQYTNIQKFKFYTRNDWPNTTWDGFRIGFFNFSGGVPGSMLWPTGGGGYFFKPSGVNGHVWVECDINWLTTKTAFVAAENQIYNYPNCDPFSVDNNETFVGHSWKYIDGVWGPMSTSGDPYRNVMLRLWVETDITNQDIAPSSIGRVKALYY